MGETVFMIEFRPVVVGLEETKNESDVKLKVAGLDLVRNIS